MDESLLILTIVLIFFLFNGEPDVYDSIRNYTITKLTVTECKND